MRYVVGVDGSPESRAALRWALDDAERHGATVDVVLAFVYSSAALFAVPEALYWSGTTYEEARKDAEARLDEIIAEALRGRPRPVPIERIATEGGAAERLLQIAEGADVLVVGSRGLGGFRGLLLGSVSQQCVQHAPCPVVVVPSHPRGG